MKVGDRQGTIQKLPCAADQEGPWKRGQYRAHVRACLMSMIDKAGRRGKVNNDTASLATLGEASQTDLCALESSPLLCHMGVCVLITSVYSVSVEYPWNTGVRDRSRAVQRNRSGMRLRERWDPSQYPTRSRRSLGVMIRSPLATSSLLRPSRGHSLPATRSKE